MTPRWLFILGAALLPLSACADLAADYQRALTLARRTEGKIFRTDLQIHWTPDGRRLWYRVRTGPQTAEYVTVELATGHTERGASFAGLGLGQLDKSTSADGSLRERPSRNGGPETSLHLANHTPGPVAVFWLDAEGRRQAYGRLEPGATRTQHTYAGHVWLFADAAGGTLAVLEATPEPLDVAIDGRAKAPPPAAPPARHTSPDDQWSVQFREANAHLLNRTTGESTPLSSDGTAARPYRGPAVWAPDSQSCVFTLVREARPRQITLVDSSPAGQVQPRLLTIPYQKPGDELPRPQPVLVRLADRQPLLINHNLFPTPFTPGGEMEFRWAPDSTEFCFDYNQRGHQCFRIVAVSAATGAPRTVVEETSAGFIDYRGKTWRHWLPATRELLWLSERDGWAHLWLYDSATGTVKTQVTRGSWVVRRVLRVNAATRQVWFTASGLHPGEDPYHEHLCRVGFDGQDFTRLTSGNGDHEVEFSPDRQFFIDTWSRPDLAPNTELRRSGDGTLVCPLEQGDLTALLASGWTLPEPFTAKGRDGSTDICGVLIKPSTFDPARQYPVLEEVYAGPHSAFAPHSFDRLTRLHTLAELGFIVVKADGMGTNHRGRAFHQVAWKNLRDAGFPDRIAWIKAAAATRPWMDLTRVGIFGGSAGGQSAMRALLDHHDFYRAAFADCGCHDNRMDKIWWNEQWLGWPVDDSYIRSSNVVDAAKLQGHLMLCAGELDTNVDPASTMQVAHALEKAGKNFELLIITGHGHGAAETPYGSRRRMDFFVRHLLRAEPPPWP